MHISIQSLLKASLPGNPGSAVPVPVPYPGPSGPVFWLQFTFSIRLLPDSCACSKSTPYSSCLKWDKGEWVQVQLEEKFVSRTVFSCANLDLLAELASHAQIYKDNLSDRSNISPVR